jgi:histone acetyltransferase (RNA polymerase elongator complex component)
MNNIDIIKPFTFNEAKIDKFKLIIYKLLSSNITNQDEMNSFLKLSKKEYSISFSNPDLLYVYKLMVANKEINENIMIEQLLRIKHVKSYSGELVVTVFTTGYPNGEKFSCKWDCSYCPNDPTQPRSYLAEEPGMIRANKNNFDCFDQMIDRMKSLNVIGNSKIDKLEVLILGGTWSSYEESYQLEFMTTVIYSANVYYEYINHNDKTKLRPMLSLEEEIDINDKNNNSCKIIGITVETRPDCINKQELIKFRKYGVTRVQLGVQHLDDRILDRVNRKCHLKDVINALELLKDNCFKVDIHIMPSLPNPWKIGVNPNKKEFTKEDVDWSYDVYKSDMKMMNDLLTRPEFQVDYIKLYPCEILPFTEIKKQYEKGLYIPYSEKITRYYSPYLEFLIRFLLNFLNLTFIFGKYTDIKKIKKNKSNKNDYRMIETDDYIKFLGIYKINFTYDKLQELLIYYKSNIPVWVRINRIIRDFPTQYVDVEKNKNEDIENIMQERNLSHKNIGNVNVNMRMTIQNIMKERGLTCKCIRCREVKENIINPENVKIMVREYKSSNGTEYFISAESYDEKYLIGFLRLRLKNNKRTFFDELEDSALIRELHVYGNMTPVNDKKNDFVQHSGYGKKLINKAFEISKLYGYNKIAVISGIGVREYYRKFGFEMEEYYMIKKFNI